MASWTVTIPIHVTDAVIHLDGEGTKEEAIEAALDRLTNADFDWYALEGLVTAESDGEDS